MPSWVEEAITWGADPPALTEARMAVGMSDLLGRPGAQTVRAWTMADLVHALLLVEAHAAQRRYDALRQIAAKHARH